MRLIDADALIEQIEDVHCKGCDSYNGVKCRACDICIGIDYLEEAPTFDPWHYPAKGEYPTEGEDVVALVKAGKKMLKGIGVYINQEWAIRHREEMWLIEPYAWQYIEPPKEEA